MKKIAFILAVLIVFVFAGCASSGGGASGSNAAPFIVDLSTLPLVKNTKPFTRDWEDLLIIIPRYDNFDITQYSRVTITAKYYNAANEEIVQGDSNCMVTLILDPDGDIRGPQDGPGPNTPVKEFNVGGFSGMIHSDRGVRINLKERPGAVLFQNNAGSDVKFIELTSLVFHNGNYSTR